MNIAEKSMEKTRFYNREDGEIVDSKTEIDDYLEVDDISNWEDIVKSNPKSEESLWTSEY